MISRRWRNGLLVLAFLVVAFSLGSAAQEQLGLSFSVEGLEKFRDWVTSLGWWGPVVFVLLVIFRLFIGLSSHLVLILGGLVFGALGGMLWGSLGLLISSLVLYGLAQFMGTEWIEKRFGHQYEAMLDRIHRVGALSVFVLTAHPFGMLTPTHIAAGMVKIKLLQFTIAVALAAPVRAVPFIFLGTAALDLTVAQSLMIAGGLLVLFAAPLLHPAVRQWLWPQPVEAVQATERR